MQVEFKKIPNSQGEMMVQVSPQEVKAYLDRAAKAISQDLKLKGFRPGKAPRSVVERQVGTQQLWEEAVKQGLPKFFEQALEQSGAEAIGRPQISIVKIAPDNPLIFKATIAIMPKVHLGEYRKLKVKKPQVKKPTAQDVQKVLKKLQQMRARLITLNRPARKGDHIEIDFSAYLKNNLIEGGRTKNHSFILGKGQFVWGFEDELVGMKAKNEKEFSIKFPRDYPRKNLAGRLIRFKVKLNFVQKLELPALDNEFAKSLGKNFKSLADLKGKLKENLETEKEMKAREKYELTILEKICAQCRMVVPTILIESEKERMIAELKADIMHQGIKFEDYLKSIKKNRKELKAGWDQQAQKRIKTSLVLREIARKEKIKVKKKEIEREINKVLRNYPDREDVHKHFQSSGYKNYMHNVLINRKVIRLLSQNR